MSFPRYESYRDSGAEWLGEVPSHWRVLSLGRITADKCDGPFGSGLKSEHYTDEGIRVIRLQNIKANQFDDNDAAYIDEDYFLTELGGHDVIHEDVLIAGLGDDRNVVGRACVAPEAIGPAMVKADCFRFRLDTATANPAFVAAQLTAGSAYDAGMLSSGSTRSRIPLSTMASRKVALPPRSEQGLIAQFLDRETAKIDALVREQRQLIELLKEKRQALISHAVTKGLDPTAPMKDSGIEWLGQVPAHWTATNLGRFSERVIVGIAEAAVHAYANEGIAILRSTNVRRGRLVGDFLYVTPDYAMERDTKMLRCGDILTVRTGHAGVSAVVPPHLDGAQCFTMLVTTPGPKMDAAYVCSFLNSLPAIFYFNVEAWGSAQPNISVPILKELPIPLPPVDEQRRIAQVIDERSREIEELIGEVEASAALLQERRAALISAAVTGKIDVRGAAPAALETEAA